MDDLLSRVEDAGLNASAPPQQRWLDGWLLRFSPGKAKRARCINAVAAGRWPVPEKLRWASQAFSEAGLPMIFRLTPFSQPADLDAALERLGYVRFDDTRVMVSSQWRSRPTELPPGTVWRRLNATDFAEAVGRLRGSPAAERLAHAQRLALSPVAYHGFAVVRQADAAVMGCGQYAREADMVGLYDVHTREDQRGLGLARRLCERLLASASAEGATLAYLQVDADNAAARRVYSGLGFADAYAYHYRQAP